MSTSAIQKPVSELDFPSSWKQEVNRRLAEHRNRKGVSAPHPLPRAEGPAGASGRAAEAAARVAARYANAPSYSEVLANEARAAIRAAEAASAAALQAKAAAQCVLAGIESAAALEQLTGIEMAPSAELAAMPAAAAAPATLAFPAMDPAVEFDFAQMRLRHAETSARPAREETVAAPAPGRSLQPVPDGFFEPALAPAGVVDPPAAHPVSIRWEPDLPARPMENARLYSSPRQGSPGLAQTETAAGDWWSVTPADEPEEIETVEPAQPIPANLIEFPRELVATRRARPRLVEASRTAAETGAQLSIFEVDPAALEPAMSAAPAAPAAWQTQWGGMRLDAQPEPEAAAYVEEPAAEADAVPAAAPAPMSLRLMALAVDASLIGAAFFSAATLAARSARTLPGPHAFEVGAAMALLLTTALYHALFFSLAQTTPGMKYARIGLRTLHGLAPTRAQRNTRLAALLLSVLPLGLGVVWSLFDEDHLSWHDRLSGTYLCRS